MTHKEQNLVISRALGKSAEAWRFFWRASPQNGWIESPEYRDLTEARRAAEDEASWGTEIGRIEQFEVAREKYTENLNAISRAVEQLCSTRARKDLYMLKLFEIIKPRGTNAERHWALHTASAAERAEALSFVMQSYWKRKETTP